MAKPHIHLIGIGGIGVSALARLYRARGIRVSGSDEVRSELTDALKREGIRIAIGPHRAKNIPDATTLVVRTSAAPDTNREVHEARQRGIPVRSYAEALGEVMDEMQGIAIAGAHGKSTTTALTALILIRGGLDPTVVVGTKLREFRDSNFRRGRSPYLVIEADEYRDAFLNYSPRVIVLTNIDREHLDHHPTLPAIEKAFREFLLRLPQNGIAIVNRKNASIRRVVVRVRRLRPDIRFINYGTTDPVAGRIQPFLKIPGRHNLANALAAYAVGKLLHVPEQKIQRAIGAYRGAWRRFDKQGLFAGAECYADYAHHPTELLATLEGVRERFPKRRIVAVFQPHHYERLKNLFREFSHAFKDADLALLIDVYEVAGREVRRKDPRISSKALAAAISRQGTKAHYLGKSVTKKNLQPHLQKGDVVLLMGAGTIWEMTKRIFPGNS